MSFLLRKKKNQVAPALQSKLDSLPSSSTSNGHAATPSKPTLPSPLPNAPRILIIGAGSRGNAYAKPVKLSGLARTVAVCEPDAFKRKDFGEKYIWGLEKRPAKAHEEFSDWSDFVKYEQTRRERVSAGELKEADDEYKGVDGVFVCVLDELHVHVVKALAPLGLHVMCEKPLATTLDDCISMYGAVTKEWELLGKKTIFSICHVLRYSPHNILLRKLVRDDKVAGDIISVEHTEPIGWWHYTHSYVRGNWRRESTSAPSLLTKSCHDIDFLLWLLCSPSTDSASPPHLPTSIVSTGSLAMYRNARKPVAAGNATNCLDCPIESSCKYSAKNIYIKKHLEFGDASWPVDIVVPEIEDIYKNQGKDAAKKRLLDALAENYGPDASDEEVRKRNWFGRCIWESDNDVCDNQTVTITWEDDPLPTSLSTKEAEDTGEIGKLNGRGGKTALFNMIAPTEMICERRGWIYGTDGEISYDSTTISVHNFATQKTVIHKPQRFGGGHGDGDDGLVINFLKAVQAVMDGNSGAEEAQREYLGCSLEEVVRSHVAVFAAEEARRKKTFVDWAEFWEREVDGRLRGSVGTELKAEVN